MQNSTKGSVGVAIARSDSVIKKEILNSKGVRLRWIGNYLIFGQMDSAQVFITYRGEVLMACESAVIANKHKEVFDGGSY